MQFCPWIALEDTPARVPKAPGVFQVRVKTGLIRYPRGQSAMVYYGASLQLDHDVTAFAHRHIGQPLLCRFAEVPAGTDPQPELERLLERFVRRFGSPPRLLA
jgi:hypothetical protein